MKVISFSNEKTRENQKFLSKFVEFQRNLYKDESYFVPLLDYEYLGNRWIGVTGFYEKRNRFFKHAKIHFFLLCKEGTSDHADDLKVSDILGRCYAFVNSTYNEHWNEKMGFFGGFESLNEPEVAKRLLTEAETWVKDQGMDTIRGPQNFPVNEAVPGLLVEGFESRPAIYYHYNFPYYKNLVLGSGYERKMDAFTWDISVQSNSIHSSLDRISRKVIERNHVTTEYWGDRPVSIRKKEMFEIYSDAWNDNFGFAPFDRDEFYNLVEEMRLIMDKKLFMFMYVNGEPAAFFGGVPNISEVMTPNSRISSELYRAIRMLFLKSRCQGFRLGYLGVRKKFRKLGLEGVILWLQSDMSKKIGYQYCEMGWVLESNALTVRLIERCGAVLSKRYSLYEKKFL